MPNYKEYQSAVSKISASDEWKAQTLAKMQQATTQNSTNVQKNIEYPKKRIITLAVAASVCFMAVPMVYNAWFGNNFSTSNEMQKSALMVADTQSQTATFEAPEDTPTLQKQETAEMATGAVSVQSDTHLILTGFDGQVVNEGQAVWQMPNSLPQTLPVYDETEQTVLGEYTVLEMQIVLEQQQFLQDQTLSEAAIVYVNRTDENANVCRVPIYRFVTQSSTTNELFTFYADCLNIFISP